MVPVTSNAGSMPPRLARSLRREVVNGKVVYVKQFAATNDDALAEVIRRRVAREAEVLALLAQRTVGSRRLGTVHVVDCDPAAGRLAIEEIPGESMEPLLLRAKGQSERRSGTRACFLAGRWLRLFQGLPQEMTEAPPESSDSDNLADYCTVRLTRLGKLGFSWHDPDTPGRIIDRISRWVAAAAEDDRALVWNHNDFGPANVMWDGNLLTPIDFEMCRPDVPLSDITYFLHRLEMLRLQFPWARLRVELLSRAMLQGYGRPDARISPMYRALEVRWHLTRMLTLTHPAQRRRSRWHNAWLRGRVQANLLRLVNSAE